MVWEGDLGLQPVTEAPSDFQEQTVVTEVTVPITGSLCSSSW